MSELIKKAQKGDVSSQVEIAESYFLGNAEERDSKQGRFWATKAAEKGDVNAQYLLAVSYLGSFPVECEINKDKAFYWASKASEQGHLGAMVITANAYLYGNGIPADPTKGIQILNQAVQLGGAEAEFLLGSLHINNMFVEEPSPTKGVQLIKSSADKEFAYAQYIIGAIYSEGVLLPQNDENAIFYLKKASEFGIQEAKTALNDIAQKSKLERQKLEQGFNAIIKLAEQGDSDSMYMYGRMLFLGELVAKDVDKGVDFLTQASEKGDREAQFFLGSAYANAIEVNLDLDKAVYFFQKAAELGHSEALYAMAYIFLYNEQYRNKYRLKLAVLNEEALSNLIKAEKLGNENAKALLKQMAEQAKAPVAVVSHFHH